MVLYSCPHISSTMPPITATSNPSFSTRKNHSPNHYASITGMWGIIATTDWIVLVSMNRRAKSPWCSHDQRVLWEALRSLRSGVKYKDTSVRGVSCPSWVQRIKKQTSAKHMSLSRIIYIHVTHFRNVWSKMIYTLTLHAVRHFSIGFCVSFQVL